MDRGFTWLCLVLVVGGAPVFAQQGSHPVSLPRTEHSVLTSKINGREYDLLVSLPQSYNRGADNRFPVIYLTDANLVFGITVQSHRLLRAADMVPDALIVGIVKAGVEDRPASEGNVAMAERVLDLTPTTSTKEERRLAANYKREVRSGGAPAFLRVVREEIIPYVNGRFRTKADDQTFIGYSLGGLFGAYVVFHAPELFRRVILVSPSLFWDDEVTLKYEEAYAKSHKSLPVRLFMSSGELEVFNIIGTMRRMTEVLTDREYQGFTLSSRIFEGEEHLSTYPVAVTRGMRAVFSTDPSR